MRALRVRLRQSAALEMRRTDVRSESLVYLVVGSRPQGYRWGRSRILYVGTTRKGVGRIAHSAASLAARVLGLHGVTRLEVLVVTCQRRQRVKTWRKLERALLLRFRENYGELPRFNQQGKQMRWTDELSYFRRERLDQIMADLED